MYYSYSLKNNEFRYGFGVSKRLHHLVSGFTTVNNRLSTIRIKEKTSCSLALTEDKDDAVKGAFNTKLEAREGIFGPSFGQFSLHNNTTSNSL